MNLNDNVSVILTQRGAEIMNEREHYFSRIIPNYKEHVYHAGEEYKTQLWCLFKNFGNYISITCQIPFEKNEIRIV